MKIVESTPSRLVAEERMSSYLFGLFFGLLFFGVGLFLLFVPGKWTGIGPLSADQTKIAFSGIFVLAGLFLAWRNARTTIVADRGVGIIRIQDERLFVLKEEKTIRTEGLKAVEIEEHEKTIRGKHGTRRKRWYSLTLVFEGVRREQVFDTEDEFGVSLFGLLQKSELEELVAFGKNLADIWKVPFEERRSPTITEVIGQLTSAIQDARGKSAEQLREQYRGKYR